MDTPSARPTPAGNTPRAALLRAQREQRFLTLQFAPPLEHDFRASVMPLKRTMARLVMLMMALALWVFVALDQLVMGAQYPSYALWALAGFCAPASLLCAGLTFVPNLSNRPDLINLAMLVAQILVWLWLYPRLPLDASGGPYAWEAGPLFINVCFSLTGLYFRQALAASLAMAVGFLVVMSGTTMSAEALTYCGYFLFAAAAAGIGSTYAFEYSLRLNYLNSELVQELAERDALTGIYNRRAFNERLETLVKQARRDRVELAVLLIDADHFKTVNDSAGHATGDTVLCGLATALSEVSRRPLDYCARLGGDEFVAVWYGLDTQALQRNCESLVSAYSLAVRGVAHKVPVPLTLSVGVCHGVPTLWATGEDYLKRADRAVYRSKADGRNRSSFSSLADVEPLTTSRGRHHA